MKAFHEEAVMSIYISIILSGIWQGKVRKFLIQKHVRRREVKWQNAIFIVISQLPGFSFGS